MAAQPAHGSAKDVYVGSFKRLESIGKGSFAVVYKAVHPSDGSLVAIKTVQHVQLKGKLKANLFSEIDILKSIQHPHIVALINILESTNHIHLVMEFCQLGDLATFVKKRDKLANHPVTADMMRNYPNPAGGGFNEVIVRHFAKQLAAALEFLRHRNLVHRDLKPQNLLLNPPHSWLAKERPENRPFEVTKDSLIPIAGLESLPALKIADFGFARHLPQTTMAETLCGSPLYMAPEILRYERYDAKADLWSVGTVLYELMVGRPPFRAANHVDLLRKIEKTMDKIKFPEDVTISADMENVIRALLKKMPAERLSWESFFESAIITQEIPGLVAADKLKKPAPRVEEQKPRSTDRYDEPFPGSRPVSIHEDSGHTPVKQNSRPSPSKGTATSPAKPTLERAGSGGAPRRPSLTSHATAPAAHMVQRDGALAAVDMERRRSQQTASPGTSVPKDPSERERERAAVRQKEQATKEIREKAAQDVAFERDYVMVEKRAVEVNAFADELAASPQIQGGNRGPTNVPQGAIVRRATTQGAPTSTTGAQNNPNRQTQVAVRPDAFHQRKHSYERKYGPGRHSATSALAAALNMVNFRLHSGPFVPGKGPSPPQPYVAFPSYPISQNPPLLVTDNSKPLNMDEDQRVLGTVEECATRSDVVYGFAEVKYKQLIPLAPSGDNGLGIRRAGSSEPPSGDSADDDEILTVDAVVGVAEEALVLYVKALAILNNTINLAGTWWSHKNRLENQSEPSSSPRTADAGRAGFAAVGMRINHVVQWARSRYNECLEKSEYVSRRLVDAQKKLPKHHPGHPSNHQPNSDIQANDLISSINLSSGITAEKLMYDRAIEMSRSAAVNELVGKDLPGCEVSYLTSIRLLEAVLETDEEPTAKKTSGSSKDKDKENKEKDEDFINGLEEGDRQSVLSLIENMRFRLRNLRKKLSPQNAPRPSSLKGPQSSSSNETPQGQSLSPNGTGGQLTQSPSK